MSSAIEKALVGSLIMYPSKFLEVCGIVSARDFTDEQSKKAFETSFGLWQKQKKVDPISVTAEAPDLSIFIASAIADGTPMGCVDYARRVAGYAKLGRINAGLEKILRTPTRIKEKLDMVLSLYNKEVDVDKKEAGIKDVLERFNKVIVTGISTGFDFLDDKYIKYVPGHIWTMGAVTSTGKTAVMIQKICNIITMKSNPSVIVVSTEMTEEQVMSRLLANFTGVHSQRILSRNYRQGEEEVVENYKKMISTKNIMIYDDIYSLSDIQSVFRKKELQGGVDVGFIDYVQNCSVPTATSSYQEGSQLAKGLQRLAKDVRATLICLSQVSNDVGRGNTEQLELKGAGEWAAVSDIGIMLEKGQRNKCALRYFVKKNRHGQLHNHLMEYKNDYTRIEAIKEFT
jgi:replicative DNA helicase